MRYTRTIKIKNKEWWEKEEDENYREKEKRNLIRGYMPSVV
jgi:hypothetical protein